MWAPTRLARILRFALGKEIPGRFYLILKDNPAMSSWSYELILSRNGKFDHKDGDWSLLSNLLPVLPIWSQYSLGHASSYDKQALVVVFSAVGFTEMKWSFPGLTALSPCFHFPNRIAFTLGTGFTHHWITEQRYRVASTFSGLQRPSQFSVHHLYIPQAILRLIMFVKLSLLFLIWEQVDQDSSLEAQWVISPERDTSL